MLYSQLVFPQKSARKFPQRFTFKSWRIQKQGTIFCCTFCRGNKFLPARQQPLSTSWLRNMQHNDKMPNWKNFMPAPRNIWYPIPYVEFHLEDIKLYYIIFLATIKDLIQELRIQFSNLDPVKKLHLQNGIMYWRSNPHPIGIHAYTFPFRRGSLSLMNKVLFHWTCFAKRN